MALQGRADENEILIDNNNVEGIHSTVSLVGKADDNKFSFENSTVNAGTWYFLTIGSISGTLGTLEKEPIGTLGRKKIL